MVIKIMELGTLTELTEEEEESYKGGTNPEIVVPVGGVPTGNSTTAQDAEKLHIIPVENVLPKPIPHTPLETT